ncbi:MAG: decarboxylase, partial [Pseudomonadota bacterium]
MNDIVHPDGARIIAGLKQAGVKFVVALPDIVTSDGLLWPISRDPDLRLVRICKEDEGISICAAMAYCGTRAVLLMQQTGLMDSLNALRAIGMDYKQPICM